MLLSVTRRSLALVAVPALLLTLPGCSSWRNSSWSPETLFGVIKPYKTDVVQGNVVTQEVMAQIQSLSEWYADYRATAPEVRGTGAHA